MGFDVHFRNSPCIGYMAEKDENISFEKETDLISGKERCYLRIKDVGEIYLGPDESKYNHLGTVRGICVENFEEVAQYLYLHFGIYFFTDLQEQEIYYIDDIVYGRDVYEIQHWMMVDEMLEYMPNCMELKLEYKKNEKLIRELGEKYNIDFVSQESKVKESIEELEKECKGDLPF